MCWPEVKNYLHRTLHTKMVGMHSIYNANNVSIIIGDHKCVNTAATSATGQRRLVSGIFLHHFRRGFIVLWWFNYLNNRMMCFWTRVWHVYIFLYICLALILSVYVQFSWKFDLSRLYWIRQRSDSKLISQSLLVYLYYFVIYFYIRFNNALLDIAVEIIIISFPTSIIGLISALSTSKNEYTKGNRER